MKTNIQSIKALFIAALVVLAVGCSEFIAPTASEPPEASGVNFQYPPVENTIDIIEGMGYRIIPVSQSALDDCDSSEVSQFCARNASLNLQSHGVVKLKWKKNVCPNSMIVRIVSPAGCLGVADFYPHPTQFNGEVEMKWDLQNVDLPEGVQFEDIIPLYIHDDGTPEEVQFSRQGGRFIVVTTNHFSRYIITRRVGA